MNRFFKRLMAVLVIGAVAGATVYYTNNPLPTRGAGNGGGGRGKGVRPEGPTPVVVATAKAIDYPILLDGVGNVRARNSVTVRPQVDGRILSIDFAEGQDVKKGDVLARLDPATYKAQLDQVVARKRLSEVQLENAERDLARFARLSTNVVAEKTVDTQRAQVAQLKAQIKADEAAIANAQAVLDYTTIVAPIDGRTGIRMADSGNLVRASDAGIVTIAEVRPIAVSFTLPQQQLQQVNQAMAKGPLKAEALDTGNRVALDTGTLTVIDNTVDSQTGTVRLKAEFPNANLQLWPGQFVNVRLLVDTLKQVIAVPAPAVQRGPAGAYVYVLKTDNTVAVRPVKLGPGSDTQMIVSDGVAPGDRVVISGFGRLSDGVDVVATEAEDKTSADPAAVPAAAATGSPVTTGEVRPDGKGKGEGRRGRRKDASAPTNSATP